MGGKHFIISGKPGWEKPYKYTLDKIISTSDCDKGFPIHGYISLLKVNGAFVA